MIDKMSRRFIGMIPARFGSSRFPGKPLALISGKSLIQRTYENALRFKELQEIIVATDNQKIAEHVRSFGGKVVMTSPECPTGTDRIAEAIKQHPQLEEADYIFNIQGDTPCVEPDLITKICEMMSADASAVMGTAAIPLVNEEEASLPSIVKCLIDKNGNALYFSRALVPTNIRGNFDPKATYLGHVGIYCFAKDFLLSYPSLSPTPLQETEELEQLRVLEHGYRIKVAVLSHKVFSPAVDLPEDIQKVEKFLCSQNISL